MADNDQPKEGRRKDGKPFKLGNTREDGSYVYGKNRAPVPHRFAKDDGRARGRRALGQKNLLTDWREELNTKVPITEGGKTRKVSKQRGMVKSTIDRGLKRSDRAAETAFRFAELSEKRDPGLQIDDLKIIEAWLSDIMQDGNTDDADEAPNSAGTGGGDSDG